MAHFWGCRVCAPDGLLLVCGQDRDGAARGGARKLLLGHAQRVRGGTGDGRQIVSQDSPYGVSRIGGQAGTQAPDPTPVPVKTGEAGPEDYPQSPCRIFRECRQNAAALYCTLMLQFCAAS